MRCELKSTWLSYTGEEQLKCFSTGEAPLRTGAIARNSVTRSLLREPTNWGDGWGAAGVQLQPFLFAAAAAPRPQRVNEKNETEGFERGRQREQDRERERDRERARGISMRSTRPGPNQLAKLAVLQGRALKSNHCLEGARWAVYIYICVCISI